MFTLVAVGLTIWAVGGTWAHGWRTEDLRVLAVIAGAWIGGWPGALLVVAVLVGWWVARRIARPLFRLARGVFRTGRWVYDHLSNASELA